MGAAAAASSTTIRFDGERELDLRQDAAVVTLTHVRASGWSFRGSLGALLGGSLDEGDRRHELGVGVIGALGASRPWTSGPWFVIGSITASASRVSTREPGGERVGLVAVDARLGAVAGRRFGAASPYVLARAFGGPVLWTVDATDVTGTDTHHYQLGAGVSVTAGAVTVVVDLAGLGERAASLGVSLRL